MILGIEYYKLQNIYIYGTNLVIKFIEVERCKNRGATYESKLQTQPAGALSRDNRRDLFWLTLQKLEKSLLFSQRKQGGYGWLFRTIYTDL